MREKGDWQAYTGITQEGVLIVSFVDTPITVFRADVRFTNHVATDKPEGQLRCLPFSPKEQMQPVPKLMNKTRRWTNP